MDGKPVQAEYFWRKIQLVRDLFAQATQEADGDVVIEHVKLPRLLSNELVGAKLARHAIKLFEALHALLDALARADKIRGRSPLR